MKQRKMSIPVIDLFAGPGGLSEGFSKFSSFKGSEVDFRIRLSIEMNPVARKTLRLRSFVRRFPEDRLPEVYYDYIRCTDTMEKEKLHKVLESFPEFACEGCRDPRFPTQPPTPHALRSGRYVISYGLEPSRSRFLAP